MVFEAWSLDYERDLRAPLLASLVVLLAIYGALRAWWFRVKYDWHRIPGPPMYPLVGHLPHFFSWEKPKTHKQLLEWGKKYGRVVKMDIGFGLTKAVWVFDPEYLQQHVTGHGKQGMPRHSIYQLFRKYSKYDNDNMITTPTPNEYTKAVRKGMAPAFSTESLKTAFPTMRQKAFELVEVIQKETSKDGIDFQELLPRCTLDIVLLSGFGVDCNSLSAKHTPLLDAMKRCDDDLFADVLNPLREVIKKYFPFSKIAVEGKRNLMDWHSEVEKKLKATVSRCQVSLDDNSLWGCLSRIKNPHTGELLDHELLWGEFFLLLLAATDSTAQQVAWALFCLATHPEIQQGVRDEMDKKGLLCSDGNSRICQFTYEEVMSLQYLTMVIKEAARMFPVVSGVTRAVEQDGDVVCGYRVPKGTMVRALIYPLHRLPSLWDEPEVFNPERFRSEFKDTSENAGSKHDSVTHVAKGTRKLWTFSDGPRNCLGQRMAMVEMQVILAVIMSRYKLRLAERMGSWEETISRQYLSVVLSVDGGMWLHCDPL